MRAHDLQPPGHAGTASGARQRDMPFAPPGRGMTPEGVLALQRSIGNRATTQPGTWIFVPGTLQL